jgi:hypothetical protein
MTATTLIPVAAAGAFLSFAVYVVAADGVHTKNRWLFPAAASLAFLLFSLHAISAEGMLGFWTEHVRNFWGNQIWLDLLLAVGIAWYFVVPQAKALGMRPLPWLVLVACTGCIGFLAMTARLLYLRDRALQRA